MAREEVVRVNWEVHISDAHRKTNECVDALANINFMMDVILSILMIVRVGLDIYLFF
jgi:hypothetical protein